MRLSNVKIAGALLAAGITAAAQNTFTLVPTPKGSGGLSAASAFSPSDIWAVGASTLHFDGTNWTKFPQAGNQPNECVNGVCTNSTSVLSGVVDVAPMDAWAIGSITTLTVTENPLNFDETIQAVFQHWDGTAWSVSPGPTFAAGDVPTLFAITAVSATDIWAVGNLLSGGGTILNFLFEHYDGVTWTPTVIPVKLSTGAFLLAASAHATNDVWAVGFKGPENDNSQTLVMHFDGASWKEIPSPSVGKGASQFNAVTALSSKDVWAVGFSTPVAPPQSAATLTLAEHWDGTAWEVVSTPNVGPASVNQSNALFGITASSPTDVWAFGSSALADGSGNQITLLMNFNGSAWAITPSPNPTAGDFLDDILSAGVSPSPGNVWIVGSEDVAVTGGGFKSLVLHGAS